MPKFPPDPSSVSRTLHTPEEFGEQFERLWRQMKKGFFKFERIQSYQEPNNPSWVLYTKGGRHGVVEAATDAVYEDREAYTNLCRDNISFVRLRAVELPLSEYLLWEFKSYQVSTRFGERILILDVTHSSDDLSRSSDFVMFDDEAVLVHNFDESGLLLGGWLIEQSEYVDEYRRLAQYGISAAVPLGVFEVEQRLVSSGIGQARDQEDSGK